MKFDKSLVLGAAKRCRFNRVQVIACKSAGAKLRLFPTSFWLTCPYLIKLAGKIESRGGVSELEKFLRDNNFYKKWHDYNLLHQVIRVRMLNKNLREFLRKYKFSMYRTLMRGGVGGIKYYFGGIHVKCIHLQTASFLALNSHPGKKWLVSQGLSGECDNCMCKDFNLQLGH